VHVFPFSPREGTEAATMPNQISTVEKNRRVAHLMQLADRLRVDFAARQTGQTVQVLFETQDNRDANATTLLGTSDRYLRTKMQVPPYQMKQLTSLIGQLVNVEVIASIGDELTVRQ